jgi:hypothetical protein
METAVDAAVLASLSRALLVGSAISRCGPRVGIDECEWSRLLSPVRCCRAGAAASQREGLRDRCAEAETAELVEVEQTPGSEPYPPGEVVEEAHRGRQALQAALQERDPGEHAEVGEAADGRPDQPEHVWVCIGTSVACKAPPFE